MRSRFANRAHTQIRKPANAKRTFRSTGRRTNFCHVHWLVLVRRGEFLQSRHDGHVSVRAGMIFNRHVIGQAVDHRMNKRLL
jgi:hypothetical protein